MEDSEKVGEADTAYDRTGRQLTYTPFATLRNRWIGSETGKKRFLPHYFPLSPSPLLSSSQTISEKRTSGKNRDGKSLSKGDRDITR